MRAHMGLYESRLFMRIVERCQVLLPNSPYKPTIYEVPNGWAYRFAFTLSSLTSSHNYNYVKAAARNLKDITCQHYDPATRQWAMAGLITQARIDEQSGVLQVEVADWVCKMIVDFRMGWRTYDLDKALLIRNPHALRLYLLTCTQNKMLSYKIEDIKGILLGDDAALLYKNNGDFVRKCIEPARKELETLGLNGFTYQAVKGDGIRKSKIQKINITPVKREERDTVNISVQRAAIQEELPADLIQYLTLNLGFTTREIKGKNMATFKAFIQLPSWREKFYDIATRMRKHYRTHGWLIQALKREAHLI